jgi:hypothetical protein
MSRVAERYSRQIIALQLTNFDEVESECGFRMRHALPVR